MFEHRNQPVIPKSQYYLRLLNGISWGLTLIGISLAIGICGYHYIDGLPWIDSLLESSMILGGMGPVSELHNNAAKLFASFYALYSGLVLIGVTGIILGPVVHRILHTFHVEK